MNFSRRHRRNSSASLHSIELPVYPRPVAENPASPIRPAPPEENQDADPPPPPITTSRPTRGARSLWRNPFTAVADFWRSSVSCELELSDCRDHLALERTFLGYLRTSVQMSMIGTGVAQLFSINQHDTGLGYTLVGKPLATVCYFFAMGTILLGAIRSWRHQRAIMAGRALTGGYELHTIGIGAVILLLVFLGFLLAIDIVKTTSDEL